MLSPDDQTLTMAIANALHDLGVPVTPQKTERGVRIAKRALEGAKRSGSTDVRALSEFEPPNPYDLPLKALRASSAVQPVRQVTPSACTPPDPYAEGLKALRAREHR